MEVKDITRNATTESKPLDSPALPDLQEQFASFLITAPPEEAKAHVGIYTTLNEAQIHLHRARHEMELEKQEKRHQQRMEVLRFLVPIFSGLVFAALGLTLIFNTNPTIQYMGVSLLFIGACALIPGVSKVLSSISEMSKSLHAISQEVRRTAAAAQASKHRKPRK